MKKSTNHYVLSLEADSAIEEIVEYTKVKYRINQAISYVTDFEVLFSQLIEPPILAKDAMTLKKDYTVFQKESIPFSTVF